MDSELRHGIAKRIVQIAAQMVLEGVVLLGAAGDWLWWRAWTMLGLSVALVAASAAWLLPRNPDVIVARSRVGEGTKRFDKVVLVFYTAAVLAVLVVAGLDARFGWSPLGWYTGFVGAVLMAAGMVPIAWAMGVNRNLEQTVRIQTDRGHQVTSEGPYRIVRHPMYAGTLVQFVGMAFLLGSGWSFVPAAACAVALVVRTALEDRTLLAELPGYPEYASRTRWRLVPFVW
jgi:protein-S-isoprenylcysteine O-methyltransferase Ste14